jgi:signal transduction histidine kinase
MHRVSSVAAPDPGGPRRKHVLDFEYHPVVGKDGVVTGIYVQGVDSEGRAGTQTGSSQNDPLYRQLFESVDEGFCVIEFFDGPHGRNRDYVHVAANAAYAMHTGIFDVVGQTVRTMLPADAVKWVKRYGAVLATGIPARFEQELVATRRHLELSAVCIGPASQRQVAVLFQDVTARRSAELALARLNATLEQEVEKRTTALMAVEDKLRRSQKLEAIGQMKGGVAHNFNNLLAGIHLGIEMVERRVKEKQTGGIGKYIEAALASTRRASSLTQHLLAFSRRQTLTPREVDLNELIDKIEDLIVQATGPRIELRVEKSELPGAVFVDSDQLMSAILNLCINARDAISGSGTLTIATACGEVMDRHAAELGLEKGVYCQIGVTDDGCGMDITTLERALDPFFTTRWIGQGTGLGLSMVYGFAKQSGGAAQILSELNVGATVTLFLPRC